MKRYIKLSYNEVEFVMDALGNTLLNPKAADAARLLSSKFPMRYCDSHGNDHKYGWIRVLFDLWYRLRKGE